MVGNFPEKIVFNRELIRRQVMWLGGFADKKRDGPKIGTQRVGAKNNYSY